ncbi:MAG: hypothetical protein RIQ81_283 [Pseudomonadota bacterium]
MILAGLSLMHFWQGNLHSSLTIPAVVPERWRLLAGAITAAGFLLTSSAALESWNQSFRELKKMFQQLIGPAPTWVALWLALVSSVGEETFFRGALQPTLGIFPTSILFGLAHLGPDGRIGVWSLWACVAGLILGWTFAESGCLWPAIVAHFLVNGISLVTLQRQYRAR